MINSGKYDVVPNYVDYQTEKSRITHRNQLYQREKELNRILLKNNKKAQDVVIVNGERAPRYLKQEISNAKRAINKYRKELVHTIYPDYDDFSPVKQRTVLSDKNLSPLQGTYQTPEDLNILISEKYRNVKDYADLYLYIWVENNGDTEVQRIIRRFERENPQALIEIFESKVDEVEIYYIYPDQKSPDKTPMGERHHKIIEFWQEMEDEYLS